VWHRMSAPAFILPSGQPGTILKLLVTPPSPPIAFAGTEFGLPSWVSRIYLWHSQRVRTVLELKVRRDISDSHRLATKVRAQFQLKTKHGVSLASLQTTPP